MKTFKQLTEIRGTENPKGNLLISMGFHSRKIYTPQELNQNERKAVQHYTGSLHEELNNFHRGKETFSPEDQESLRDSSRHMDNAIHKHITTKPIHVWRGIVHKADIGSFNGNPGDIIHDKGYVSTSVNPKVATNFLKYETPHLFHIKVPAGSHAIIPDHHKIPVPRHEQELILPRNSKFRYEGTSTEILKNELGIRAAHIIHHLTHIPDSEKPVVPSITYRQSKVPRLFI